MSLLDNLAHLLQGHQQAPQQRIVEHAQLPQAPQAQQFPQFQPMQKVGVSPAPSSGGYGGRGPAFSGQAAPAQPAFMGQLRVAPNQYGQQPHIPFGGMPRFDGANEQTTIDPTNYGRMGFGANVSPDDLDMIPGLGYLQGRYTEQPHQRYNNY